MSDALQECLAKIRLIVADVDGVFTDGSLYIGADGQELKRFHVLDGAGIALLRAVNFPIVMISARQSTVTENRMKELGLGDALYQGNPVKLEPYEAIKKRYDVRDEEVAYIGDDIIDIPVLKRVGLPVAVTNASPEVKQYALYVTQLRGGEGAVREVIELILEAHQLKRKAVAILTKEICEDQSHND